MVTDKWILLEQMALSIDTDDRLPSLSVLLLEYPIIYRNTMGKVREIAVKTKCPPH